MSETEPSAAESLEIARRHLIRVEDAWTEPDWSDLSIYGLYALEAAVKAASTHLGWKPQREHWATAKAAKILAKKHGLPDITKLLPKLNIARKAVAYGDMIFPPQMDAEDVAGQVGSYVEAVAKLLAK